jgi:uncharacterized protein YijF (DUF1287 family)
MFNRRVLVRGAITAVAGAGLVRPPLSRLTAMAQVHLPEPEPWALELIAAAEDQIGETIVYDPGYSVIAYPMGDIARSRGVCTDVVIRAYRDAFGLDLQRLVHEDMAKNFSAYPQDWGLKRPDASIDHRRVPNLKAYLTRRGARLLAGERPDDFRPGDLVTQVLPGNLAHIAIVSHRPNADHSRLLVVHNIGRGARIEDTLLAFTITGQFRLPPPA